MVDASGLPRVANEPVQAYRLVNSKFPPLPLFEDVANADEFEALYELQALTNPRLRAEAGDCSLVSLDEIPFGIRGCSYAMAPFTHVNPDGSRFSDGSFGVFYAADTLDTAVAEVQYHQERYWRKVPALHYERFVFRSLACTFKGESLLDGLAAPMDDPIYRPDDYTVSRNFGRQLKRERWEGLRYWSVRKPSAVCWALLTPRLLTAIIQGLHLEMVWSEGITHVNQLAAL